MALFKKKDKVIDLTGYYEKNKEKFDNLQENQPQKEYEEIPINPRASPAVSPEIETTTTPIKTDTGNSGSGFFGGFFGGGSSSSSSASSTSEPTPGISDSVNPDERRRKLAKRLGDMTSKIEDLSNQIYHLQQRLEVVERKLDVNRF
jgi:hypothetical protein